MRYSSGSFTAASTFFIASATMLPMSRSRTLHLMAMRRWLPSRWTWLKPSDFLNSADVAQDVGDLSGDAFELEHISPVELDGQLALHAGERLVDVVLDRLREVRGDPRDGLGAPRHRLDQLVLVVDAPRFARFESDVELGGVGAVDVGAVVRRAELGDHHADLGEGQQPLADVVDGRVGVLQRDANGEIHAQPDISLV